MHVVRCFEDENIVHVEGRINPISDIEIIDTELLLKDLETVEKRADRIRRQAKGDKTVRAQVEFLERLQTHLEEGKAARAFDVDEVSEGATFRELCLLTAKPVL